MKNIFQKIISGFLLMLLLASCEKEENKIYFEGATKSPELSSSVATLELSEATAADHLVDLTWTNPEYMFTTGVSSQNVNYLLEVDVAGNNFAGADKFQATIENELKKSFTVTEFNDILVQRLKLAAGEAATVEARIVATIDNVASTRSVSNVLSFSVTPYDVAAKIFYMYAPGNYAEPTWAPANSAKVGSLDEVAYEGYIYFEIDNSEFKFTSIPDWAGTNYGAGAGATDLDTDGGAANLKIATKGMYLVKADRTALKWSATTTNWGLIGDATPGGWDTSTPMEYDPATKKLMIDLVALTANKFKFRANDAWDINLGADADNPDYLKYGGADITVAEAGNYKIELDLSNPLQYTYTLTKL